MTDDRTLIDPEHIRAERLGEVLAELEDLRRRRQAIADDDFLGMLEIKERDRELRTKASELRAATRPLATAEQIRSELERIERQLAGIRATHIDVVKQAGGGSGGGDFRFATDAFILNRQIDEAAGGPALEARAQELRNQLDALGAS
jgi:hypothetical protein